MHAKERLTATAATAACAPAGAEEEEGAVDPLRRSRAAAAWAAWGS
jgi:hypothetical protein